MALFPQSQALATFVTVFDFRFSSEEVSKRVKQKAQTTLPNKQIPPKHKSNLLELFPSESSDIGNC